MSDKVIGNSSLVTVWFAVTFDKSAEGDTALPA